MIGVQKGIFFKPNGSKLASYLESLGPIFTKFGQLLSTRTDILDAETAKELESLTDSCKPFNVEKLVNIVESELGDSIENIFESFDKEPLAAASLAQVHSAKLKNGDQVVIKVLRPNIEKKVKKNLEENRASTGMTDMVLEVVVPTENVAEVKRGEQKISEKLSQS